MRQPHAIYVIYDTLKADRLACKSSVSAVAEQRLTVSPCSVYERQLITRTVGCMPSIEDSGMWPAYIYFIFSEASKCRFPLADLHSGSIDIGILHSGHHLDSTEEMRRSRLSYVAHAYLTVLILIMIPFVSRGRVVWWRDSSDYVSRWWGCLYR